MLACFDKGIRFYEFMHIGDWLQSEFFPIFHKGDNFHDFQFVFLYMKPLL